MVNSITVIGGHGKDGERELVEKVNFRMGDVVSIVEIGRAHV